MSLTNKRRTFGNDEPDFLTPLPEGKSVEPKGKRLKTLAENIKHIVHLKPGIILCGSGIWTL